MDSSKIKEYMEVVGSDGQHVGTVDHLEGADKIKLTKNDPAAHGHHHLIPLAWVSGVDTKVHLSKTMSEATQAWEHAA
jgi:hypothetical protein